MGANIYSSNGRIVNNYSETAQAMFRVMCAAKMDWVRARNNSKSLPDEVLALKNRYESLKRLMDEQFEKEDNA